MKTKLNSNSKLILFSLLVIINLMINSAFATTVKPLTLLLDWFPNPDHAALFVAQEKGFFQKEGLTVNIIAPADPDDPPKFVAVGKADIALTYQPQFVINVSKGLPLVRFATLIDTPLSCLVVNGKSNIQSIKDLKGKTIAYSGGSMNHVALQIMLKYNGLTLNDVKTINVHYDLTQALLSQRVDAVTGMMRNFELLQMKLHNAPGKAFYPEENGMPAYDELIW